MNRMKLTHNMEVVSSRLRPESLKQQNQFRFNFNASVSVAIC
jgi:hypothetical protein